MMTIRLTLDLFLKDRSAYCSDKTLEKYREDVGYFFLFLEKDLLVSVDHISYGELPADLKIFQEFVIRLRNKSVRNVTIRSYCRSVKVYLTYCYEHDLCRDYLKGVRLPKDDSLPKIPLYVHEVDSIDAQFDRKTEYGARNYCIVHLMLDCGLRCQEVLQLKAEHIDRQHNILHILDSKGHKSRMILIPDFLLDALYSYLCMSGRSSGLVFLLKDGGYLTHNAVKMLFQRLKERTGIRRLHAHLLRHTFATSYLLGGGNLEYLRVFMGHYDYSVTKNYSSLAAQCRMLGADIYKLDDIFFTRGY